MGTFTRFSRLNQLTYLSLPCSIPPQYPRTTFEIPPRESSRQCTARPLTDRSSFPRELAQEQVEQYISSASTIIARLKAGERPMDGCPFHVIRLHPSGELIGMYCLLAGFD